MASDAEILAAEHWREYHTKNPGSLQPETMVGQHSYVIEKSVQFALEAIKGSALSALFGPKQPLVQMSGAVPHPYLPRHEDCGGQHAYGDCPKGKRLDTQA